MVRMAEESASLADDSQWSIVRAMPRDTTQHFDMPDRSAEPLGGSRVPTDRVEARWASMRCDTV